LSGRRGGEKRTKGVITFFSRKREGGGILLSSYVEKENSAITEDEKKPSLLHHEGEMARRDRGIIPMSAFWVKQKAQTLDFDWEKERTRASSRA